MATMRPRSIRCPPQPSDMRSLVVITAATVLAGTACDLQELTIAEPADLVVAEVVLQAGVSAQRALLYRTRGSGDLRVPGAIVEVRDRTGGVVRLLPADASLCLDLGQDDIDPRLASCYYTGVTSSYAIAPGTTYDLEIVLADGGVMTATTTTPDEFAMQIPATASCFLSPDSVLELRWSHAAGAWAYIAETSLAGIRAALDARGIDVDRDPLRLLGLAITQEDTTIAFPAEFGLFDRAEPGLADALVAIQQGLPPGVVAQTIIAAVDRNWVNWARGGSFNPSGIVRVPSIRGDGTGVFGAFVVKEIEISTRIEAGYPPC